MGKIRDFWNHWMLRKPYFDVNGIRVSVTQLTGKDLLDRFAAVTINKPTTSPDLLGMYLSEHSPIRTQLFEVHISGIPTFVHTHFRAHAIGTVHCTKSNREDRPGYTGDTGRWHPVNHAILLNAQSLINVSRRRMCHRSHPISRQVMKMIHLQIGQLDPDLFEVMLPNCLYRGGVCYEHVCCGKIPNVSHYKWIDLKRYTWDDPLDGFKLPKRGR